MWAGVVVVLVASTACGSSQTTQCADYLACQQAVDALAGTAQSAELEEVFGQNGTCWTTTEEAAADCDVACGLWLEENAEAYPDVQACGSGASE
jgi:hypothetical protein